jgi:predicted Zn-ribbon and HTH transcriptional regulator
MNECKCEKCGYEWLSRVKEPKACPNCTSRRWNKKKKEEAK